jgi:hypothetical protein
MRIRHNETMVVNGRLKQVGLSFRVPIGKQKARQAVFECDCGQRMVMFVGNVKSNKSKSCGCLNDEVRGQCFVTHGHSRLGKRTSEYKIWCGIIRRCECQSEKCFKYYGGRGIRVCERWRHSYESFFNDMGERPEGTSIDRIDTNGNYEPGNCRWATQIEQARNKTTSVMLTIGGETKCRGEWAAQDDAADYFTIRQRERRGWTHEEAVFGKRK